MFDGGSELNLLEAVPEHERSDAQTEALQTLAARVPTGAGAGAAFSALPPTQLLAHADSL